MATRTNSNSDPLQRYREKRDFSITSEPPPKAKKSQGGLQFVIQKHWATRLHYDFRLELDGVLLSWAVPKGPSFDPQEKRIAVQTEDHPLDYASFEGTIPPKQYGAGTVIVWDRGTWEPEGDPREGYAKGKLLFRLHGEKLAGLWELVRINPKEGEKQIPWILFKKKDRWARPLSEYDVVTALPDSVNAKPIGPVEKREHADAENGEDPLGGAVKAPLPDKLSPQLATLTKAAPTVGDWIYEIKLDGYRILARVEDGKARLITRNGNDWTDKMKSLAKEVESLGVRSGWLDGEVVVLGSDGVPNFNALQNAFDSARTDTITYFIFDAPYFEGYDLRAVPLYARRAMLKQLLDEKGTDRVRFSEAFEASAASVLQSACALNLEGVIAKRKDAPYVSDRSDTWLKLKCSSRQEFVIGGYSDRTNAPDEVGSMMLGVYDDEGRLLSVGSVGTGWDHETGRELKRKLAKLRTEKSPFDPSAPPKPGRWSRRVAGTEHWVKPQLVAEVSFTEWTPDGHIRHPSFVGLRTDKPAKAITREQTAAPPAPRDSVSGVKVSNPDRVIDPTTGIKKLDLVRYYESVAEFILPHLKGRPTSLVRAPSGITGELFFQKHPEKLKIPGITMLDPALWPGHDALLQIDNEEALIGAAQMNVIEFHTWNALSKNIDKPDRFILDLDPGEGVTWPKLQEAAVLTRTLLDELGLKCWLKTSGGKGLHVVVPIAPRYGWEAVKAFSQAVVQHMAKVIPQRFVAKSGGSNRVGKIFIDYLRNGHGQTTACAFSARSRPGMGVSIPVSWEQLASLKGGSQWTVLTAREYLSFQKEHPWSDYWPARQAISGAMKRLAFDPAARTT